MMIRQILVPTDFSETAANAFQYAQQLARQLGASLTLMHVYHPSFDLNNPYLDVPVSDFGDFKQKALDRFMRDYSVTFSEEGGQEEVVVNPLLAVGFAGEEIVRHAPDADMIVMGTTGAGQLLERWFGSVSSYVARHAHRPVLLIPPAAEFRFPRRIMYTSNYESADEALLRKAIEQSGLKPETIFFVHADREKGVTCEVAEVRYKHLLQAGGPKLDLQFVHLGCENILEGLHRYAKDNDIELIIMGTVHRSFLERIFHRSITKGMILKTDLPILIMHFDD
jgi:nucleotide-binding universal stress UspA family protein